MLTKVTLNHVRYRWMVVGSKRVISSANRVVTTVAHFIKRVTDATLLIFFLENLVKYGKKKKKRGFIELS